MNRDDCDLLSTLQVMSSDIFICSRWNHHCCQLSILLLYQKRLFPQWRQRSIHAYTTDHCVTLECQSGIGRKAASGYTLPYGTWNHKGSCFKALISQAHHKGRMKWLPRLSIISRAETLCLSAKDIQNPFRNVLSSIDLQRKLVTLCLKLLQFCKDFTPILHDTVERIWRKTKDCFKYFWDTRHNLIVYVLFKSCQISSAFLPSLFEQEFKMNSPQICCHFEVHLKFFIAFSKISWCFYKYLPALCQKKMHMDLFLQRWLTWSG